MGLPILAEDALCSECHSPCCVAYVVPITGFDLWRMMRSLGLPWQSVAVVRSDYESFWDAFGLDETGQRHGLFLRTRSTGDCQFLLGLPEGRPRCGAYAARPLACRVYPFKAIAEPGRPFALELLHHAMCPPRERAGFERLAPSFEPRVTAELLERELYLFAVRRWNGVAATVPRQQPWGAVEFVDWIVRLYDAVHPLRTGPFESWQGAARALIGSFPLPEIYGSGV